MVKKEKLTAKPCKKSGLTRIFYRISELMFITLALSLAGCADASNKKFDINSVQSYKDIPGVTGEEIAAIEALKAGREKFIYGQIKTTEAFILPDGTYGGFTARFSGLLTRLFGIEFSLELHDWDVLKSGIDGNLIDFTGDLTPTDERMRQYFMTYPIAERPIRIFQHVDSAEILAEKDINGLRAGSLTGTINVDRVRQYYPTLTFSVVEVESIASAAQMLKSGEIDVFISEGVIDPMFDAYDFIKSKEFFPLVYNHVSLATANNGLKPVIDVVNKYISAGGIDTLAGYYRAGDSEYARNKLGKSFTEEERAWLNSLAARNAPVKIALEQDNYPVSFYNKTDKEYQGIAVDVLSKISELTGIKFETVNDEKTPWSKIFEMLRSGEAAMVTQLLYSEERKGSFLWADVPYASAHYALISKSEYPNLASYQVAMTKVGAVKGSAYEDRYNEWFPNSENIVLYGNQVELLDALENGDIDLLMGSNYLLLTQQNYREKPGYKINIRFSLPMDSFFGFNKNETALCAIINKVQSYVNTDAITEDWTSRGYDYSKKLAQQRSLFFLGISTVLAIVLILSLIFLVKNKKINVRLDKTVNEMTLDLRASVAQLNAVIANYSGVIWSVDKNNIITLFKGLYLNEIGVTPDFLEGRSLDVARQKNRHQDIVDTVRDTLEDGLARDWVSEIDGKMFRSRTIAINGDDGKVASVVGNTDEITETIKLQQELVIAVGKAEAAVQAMKSAQITVSAMFESNPHMNILFDESFNVIDCNPASYSFLGFEKKEDMQSGFIERMTKCIPEVQSDGRQSISLRDRLTTASKEGYAKFETELVIEGVTRILSVEFKKIPYDEGFAIVAYVFDMTEIHEREMELIRRDQQLLEAVEEARAANRAKSAFLSNMSHEIRTPMNAILGITEIQLQNDSLNSGLKEALGKIFNSGTLLLGIINDILDLSKIEAGKLELVITNYRFASLINDTAQVNIMRIGGKPIKFEIHVDENAPAELTGDELRIKQILNNLLSNAFKYTKEGLVTLSISAETGGGENEVTLVFSVKDTGQGMTEEQVSKLFDEYSRFNLEANRTTEGTGLGMSITRNLVHMMNGEILVTSEAGKGSVFTVRIPQGDTGAGPLGRETAENLQQFQANSQDYAKKTQVSRDLMPYGSVLVVDDVETNIYVARGLLTPYGLRIDSADSGFAAIDKINGGNVYDVVFMDHMMPKMDGIETTKKIRDMGYTGTVVALTANAVVGQSEIFLSSGFDDFISKPIDVKQLNNILNKFIRDKQPSEVLEAARRQADEMKKQNDGREQPVAAGTAVTSVKSVTSIIDNEIAKIFTRDASKVLATLDEIFAKPGRISEEDMRTFVINVHGMKSALANIGRTDLSTTARELEQTGRDNNADVVSAQAPAFLDSLRTLIGELTPKKEETGGEAIDDDRPYLLEKLRALKEASAAYDKKAARGVMADLKEKTWSQPTMEFLDAIAENLLHSEFDEIVSAVDKFI